MAISGSFLFECQDLLLTIWLSLKAVFLPSERRLHDLKSAFFQIYIKCFLHSASDMLQHKNGKIPAGLTNPAGSVRILSI